ncbi:MAG TPA: methyl-accepting chemotaxis protein [Alphaproteobacteria bacterium]|nr:methyl-accepting chemotaxis protein [Alphaproteobacteria bacterium]
MLFSFVDNAKVSVKLPLFMIALAALNAAGVGYMAIKDADEVITNQTKAEMSAIRSQTVKSLDNYIKSISEDLQITASSDFTRQVLRNYATAWNDLPAGDKTTYLQKAYIDNNPNETGKKHLLDAASDGSMYSALHAKYHPWFRKFLETREYYDIFLFDADGDIVYTVFKERDFATNAVRGQWKDTDIMALFRAAKDNPEKDKIFFYDFKPYAPSADVPAAFIGTPILDSDGSFMGVLAFQMPIGRINAITHIPEDVSSTSEVHIVGADGLLRNDPNINDNEDPILKQQMDMSLVAKMMNGETGAGWSNDGGEVTMVAYQPYEVYGTKWGVFADMLHEEALEANHVIEKGILGSSVVILLIVAVISSLIAKGLTSPINKMVSIMATMAKGDYTLTVPSQDRGDEIGNIARAVEVFRGNGLAVERMRAEQEALEARAEIEKRTAMNKLADDFDSRTAGIIKSLAAAATEMQATAQQMTAVSANTAQASRVVASAASDADNNVQIVASAAEELSVSSREISQQITNVAQKSSRASGEAQRTNEQVSELNVLADSIGDVISSIKEIAEQTNLLALNATIEAARAGEAGKGFAVVADEVKKLATETASKTIEIDERVGRIQEAIRSSVEAVGRIIGDVQEIDHATTTVAGAVEEQNAATAEIGRNVAEASHGTQQVAHNIHEVERNASETGDSARALNEAASELAHIAETLQVQVAEFLSGIRRG